MLARQTCVHAAGDHALESALRTNRADVDVGQHRSGKQHTDQAMQEAGDSLSVIRQDCAGPIRQQPVWASTKPPASTIQNRAFWPALNRCAGKCPAPMNTPPARSQVKSAVWNRLSRRQRMATARIDAQKT